MPPKKKESEDQQDVLFQKNRPLAPGEREEALRKRADAIASGDPIIVGGAGFSITLDPVACTIEGDEIHCTVQADGIVHRPEARAIPKGHTVVVKIPAKVERKGG